MFVVTIVLLSEKEMRHIHILRFLCLLMFLHLLIKVEYIKSTILILLTYLLFFLYYHNINNNIKNNIT
jgi:hypothetical protein